MKIFLSFFFPVSAVELFLRVRLAARRTLLLWKRVHRYMSLSHPQVVKALHYLQSQLKVMHRDVKPSNILINSNGDVKMCDFGISGHLVDSVAKTMEAGCKPYMAVSIRVSSMVKRNNLAASVAGHPCGGRYLSDQVKKFCWQR